MKTYTKLKICFIFSNRSEYSLLEPFVKYFKYKRVEVTIIDLSKKIKRLEEDENLVKIYTLCLQELSTKKYDYVCLVGDRKELPFVSFAAFFKNIPIVHLAAGEYIPSLPTYDQFFRPIITILSSIQISFSRKAKLKVDKFLRSLEYITPNSYFTGNPLFYGINTKKLKRKITEKYDMVLIHPQSMSIKRTKEDVSRLSKLLRNKKTIFIKGNKDRNYDVIESYYQKIKHRKNYKFYDSLPRQDYFALVKHCDKFFTNTSGISEIKYLNKKAYHNIGLRNKSRLEYELNNKAPEMLYKILKKKIEF